MEALLTELRAAQTDEGRLHAALRLRSWAISESQRLHQDHHQLALNDAIFSLANSKMDSDKMCAVVLILVLIDEGLPDIEARTLRYADYLRAIPGNATEPIVLRMSARALGRLARVGGSVASQFVEHEVSRALEWLKVVEPRSESQKLASVYILCELAEAAPTHVYPHASTFFAHVWSALADPKPVVREAAARALHAVLVLVAARRSRSRDTAYASLFKVARTVLAASAPLGAGAALGATAAPSKSTPADLVHGALLVLAELLEAGDTAGFLGPRFGEVCDSVLRHRDDRDRLTRRTVLVLLPRLAHYHPDAFCSGFAAPALAHLLSVAESARGDVRDVGSVGVGGARAGAGPGAAALVGADRATAFVAVGRVALAAGRRLLLDETLRPALDRALAAARDAMTGAASGALPRGGLPRDTPAVAQVAAGFVPEALTCVAMLARAVGPGLVDSIGAGGAGGDLIDAMFNGGLSALLAEALQALASCVPALRPLLTERLLGELSLTLAGHPFTPPASVARARRGVRGISAVEAVSGPAVGGLSAVFGGGWGGEDEGDFNGAPPPPSFSLAGLQRRAALAAADAGIDAPAWGNGGIGHAGADGSATGAAPMTYGARLAAAAAAVAASTRATVTGSAGANGGGGSSSGGGVPTSAGGAKTRGAGLGPPATATSSRSGIGFGWGRTPSAAPAAAGAVPSDAWRSTRAVFGAAGVSSSASQPPLDQSGQGDEAAHSAAAAFAAAMAAGFPAPPIILASARGVPPATVILALRLVGSFDWAPDGGGGGAPPLLPFVRDVVLPYLDATSARVRLAAALTACRVVAAEGGAGVGLARSLLLDDGDTRDDYDYDDDGDVANVAGDVEALDNSATASTAKRRKEVWYVDAPGAWSEQYDADLDTSAMVGTLSAASRDAAARRFRRQPHLWAQTAASAKSPAHPLITFKAATHPFLRHRAALHSGGNPDGWSRGLRYGDNVLAAAAITSPVAAAMEAAAADAAHAGGYKIFGATPEPLIGGGAGATRAVVRCIIERLLVVAVTDADESVRFNVLAALDARFDALLAEDSSARLLLEGAADEHPGVREAALLTLARIAPAQPSLVTPVLRRTLLSALAELEHRYGWGGNFSSAEFGVDGGRDSSESGVDDSIAHSLIGGGALALLSDFGRGKDHLDSWHVPLGVAARPGAVSESPWAFYSDGGDATAADAAAGSEDTPLPFAAMLASMRAGGYAASREHAVRVLSLLLRTSARLCAPHAPVILRALLPHALSRSFSDDARGRASTGALHATRDRRSADGAVRSVGASDVLSCAVLGALGELSAVSAGALVPHLGAVLHLLCVHAVQGGAVALGLLRRSSGGRGDGTRRGSGGGRLIASAAYGGESEYQSHNATLVGEDDADEVTGDELRTAVISSVASSENDYATLSAIIPRHRSGGAVGSMTYLEAAVRALGLVVENTGAVVVPFLDHPQLLAVLLALLSFGGERGAAATPAGGAPADPVTSRSGSQNGLRQHHLTSAYAPGAVPLRNRNASLRIEAMRTLGIIGALDPARFRLAEVARSQRMGTQLQAAVQARLSKLIAAEHADKARLARAGLSPDVLRRGVRPGEGRDGDGAPHAPADHRFHGGMRDGAVLETSGPAPWHLHLARLPYVVNGVAVGGGIGVDPMEAALAGLAGEPGANVGVNNDELALLGVAGAAGGGFASAFGLGVAAGATSDDAFTAHWGGGGLDMLDIGLSWPTAVGAHLSGRAADDDAQRGRYDGVDTLLPPVSQGGAGVNSIDDASFYPSAAVSALLGVLRDPGLATHHNAALQAAMLTLRALGSSRAVSFLPRLLPAFAAVLRANITTQRGGAHHGAVGARAWRQRKPLDGAPGGGDASTGASRMRGAAARLAASLGGNTIASGVAGGPGGGGGDPYVDGSGASRGSDDAASAAAAIRDTVLQQLAAVIALVRGAIRPWIPALFALLRDDLWPESLPSLLRVVEATAAVLGEESKPTLGTLVPHMLAVLDATSSEASDGAGEGRAPPSVLQPSSAALRLPERQQASRSRPRPAQARRVADAPVSHEMGAGGGDGMPQSAIHTDGGRTAVLARHVLHTIVLLVCGGRRALWGGSRHLLDDWGDALWPAIARIADAPTTPTQRRAAAVTVARRAAGEVADAAAQRGGVGAHSTARPVELRVQAIDSLSAVAAAGVPLAHLAPRLLQPLLRTLADAVATSPLAVKRAVLDFACLLLLQMRDEFIVWVGAVRRALQVATAEAAAGTVDGNGAGGASSQTPLHTAASSVAATIGGTAAAGGAASDSATGGALLLAVAGLGGVSGAGPGSAVRHDAYERLVALLLGFGAGYGSGADDGMALYGYGAPAALPLDPVDIAAFLSDSAGVLSTDGSGVRLARMLALPVSHAAFVEASGDNVTAGAVAGMGGLAAVLATITADTETWALGAGLVPTDSTDTMSLPSGTLPASSTTLLPINMDVLRRAWDITGSRACSTADDWNEWLRRLGVELLRESPSPALRSCCILGAAHAPFAAVLFNAAFTAVWCELPDDARDSLASSIETAMKSPTAPTPLLASLLALAEFMEHAERPFPFEVRTLSALAERVGAFAQALYYKEMENGTGAPGGDMVEALISINNHLEQPEAAVGILKFAQMQAAGVAPYGVRAAHAIGPPALLGTAPPGAVPPIAAGSDAAIAEGWFEKLGRWEDALAAYEARQVESPNSIGLVLGRMRCLRALGEWAALDALATDAWPRLEGNNEGRTAVAPLAARAAWSLGEWRRMREFVTYTEETSLQGAFYRAVLALHELAYDDAARYIHDARRVLADEFAASAGAAGGGGSSGHAGGGSASSSSTGGGEYGRAYRRLVTVQQLSEMEEILTYLRLGAASADVSDGGNSTGAASAYLSHLRAMWEARLRGCARNVDVWNRILSVRSLVVSAGAGGATDNMGDWLQFASLCRHAGRMGMAANVIEGLAAGGVGGGVSGEHGDLLDAARAVRSYSSPLRDRVAVSLRLAPATHDGANTTIGVRDAEYFEGARVPHPRVLYAALKHAWARGQQDKAEDGLRRLTALLQARAAARAASSQGLTAAAVAAAAAARVWTLHLVDGTNDTDASHATAPAADIAAAAIAGAFGATHTMDAADENALRVQCLLRLGQWREALLEPRLSRHGVIASNGTPGRSSASSTAASATDEQPLVSVAMGSGAYARLVSPVLSAFRAATHDCGERGWGHYRAWHAWALANYSAAQRHHEAWKAMRGGPSGAGHGAAVGGRGGRTGSSVARGRGGGAAAADDPSNAPPPGHAADADASWPASKIIAAVSSHAVAAVKGFFRSIALGRTRLKAHVLQDLLRLLTLWFSHGESPAVRAALEAGLASGAVSMEVWLQVIPQLIARISTNSPATRKLLLALLSQIGAAHPQALVYPLTVAVKSVSQHRRSAAVSLMSGLRRRAPALLGDAEMVSRELMRVAILWMERWHAGLEEASQRCFGDKDTDAMLDVLLPLHEMMTDPGPATLREVAFVQAFGRDLDDAHRWLLSYKMSRRDADLTQAWDVYYNVFRRISKLIPALTSLQLAQVSPSLLCAHDLALAVPGTYSATSPLVRIISFSPSVTVISSKQRPRKIELLGSDGRVYAFLLKGHEDLRQDERVMQLFGLVNTLLANDSDTSRRDLSIRRYAVTPLSHEAGVVGWVPNCDTLHSLIHEYRGARKISLNIEHRIMLQMAPPYEFLPPLAKVEAFRYTLDSTTGNDVAKILWAKSVSSEAWLERRTAFTRSLAVMSIVGYILGLGDRHPSNLMLDRGSGKILHIDFGDCFEITMTREKYPERVPFRLTRMLVGGMEVAGIEGTYRSTAEAVARMLRVHRDSVMALLEAFVHDPLLNWRLLSEGKAGGANAAVAAVPNAAGAVMQATNNAAAAAVAGAGIDGGGPPVATAGSALAATGKKFVDEANAAAIEAVKAAAGYAYAGFDDAAASEHARSYVAIHSVRGYTSGQGRPRGTSTAGPGVAMRAGIGDGAAGESAIDEGHGDAGGDALNARAVAVIRRIAAKLSGRDFAPGDPIARLMSLGVGLDPALGGVTGGSGDAHRGDGGSQSNDVLDVPAQVHRLVCAAMSCENMAAAYAGWCPWW